MVSARNIVPIEARRRALTWLEQDGTGTFDSWRVTPAVTELRWLTRGLTSELRTSLDTTLREFMATADPATGLASAYLLHALVLAVLDDGECSRPH